MFLETALLVVILLLCLFIVISVLGSKDSVNASQRKSFAVMVGWVFMWVLTILVTDLFSHNLGVALWASRFSFTTTALIAYWYYLFVNKYRKKQYGNNINVENFLITFVSILIVIATLTSAIQKDVNIVGEELKSTFGFLYEPFAIFTGFIFVYSATRFFKLYKNEKNQVLKTQMLYILVGSILSIGASFTTNLIFPMLGFKEVRVLGPMGLTFFIFSTYYAILRYRFLSTKILVRKTFSTVILSLIPYGVFHLVTFIQDRLWGGIYHLGALITGYVYSSIFIYLFIYANNEIESLIKNLFLKGSVDPQEKKDLIIKKLNSTLDLTEAFDLVLNLIKDIFESDSAIIVVKENGVIERNGGCTLSRDKVRKLKSVDSMIIRDEYIYLNQGRSELIEMMKKRSIQCVFPLNLSKEMKWNVYLLICDRRTSNTYSVQDIQYIESVLSVLSVVVQRAYLHEKVVEFNKTLQSKVNEQTKDLKDKIKQIEEVRRREHDMIDIMGHELRTPMSIIKNYFSLLLHKLPEKKKEEWDRYLHSIQENIDREIRLINTLLSATKVDDSELELMREPVDMIDVIEDGILGQKNIAEGKNLYIDFDEPPKSDDFPRAYADRVRVQEIVDNLLNNAVKYTETGGVTIDIEHDEDFITVHIKDTGVGIPEKELKRIGKKFYRVKQYVGDKQHEDSGVVRPGGSGLGLYVTFGLVKAHGGKIWVDSKVGEGSTFHFTIPIYKGQEVSKRDDADMFKKLGLKD